MPNQTVTSEAAKELTPAAKRALEEAARRATGSSPESSHPAGEVGGPKGPDPTRFGDWERNGIASDF